VTVPPCACASDFEMARPEPANTVLKRAVALFEWIKNALHNFRFHADAGVANANGENCFRWIVRGDWDVSLFRREFDCVLKQIPNDLLKFRGVGGYMAALCSQIEMHMKSFGSRLGAANLHDVRHRLVCIDWSKTQLHFVSGDSSENFAPDNKTDQRLIRANFAKGLPFSRITTPGRECAQPMTRRVTVLQCLDDQQISSFLQSGS
jgi:hypothetical protein